MATISRISKLTWTEPNRAKSPSLHIASRGERFSTLTGVCWIDEFRFVVNHRDGLRLALFDIRHPERPVVAPIPHLTDDIAAKRLYECTWEVAVSGCWDAAYSTYRLVLDGQDARFQRISTMRGADRTFCHGVAYDAEGNLCLAFHTGEIPRIVIAGEVWRFPLPWGPRDVCHDAERGVYYAVAVSKNPRRVAYGQASTSIWSMHPEEGLWRMVDVIDDMHSDACQVYGGWLWFPDQNGDRVLAYCLERKQAPLVINGGFDFPHGLGISPDGILAVTNYGSSSVVLLDISNVKRVAAVV